MDDIVQVWSYIAEDSERAADRVEAAIYSACALIGESTSRGHARRDLTSLPLLFWTVTRYPKYVIVYRPQTAPVEVVAVSHGKRNLRAMLRDIH